MRSPRVIYKTFPYIQMTFLCYLHLTSLPI